ncbi:carbonic anhydrase [Tenacibaculum maritimum]|uniref:carbonic anhydrase n=1 Tax=Tenacibaculum maritimum TaxID=107401 RepID=UPI0012E6301A|nr:carbonic anhydrase family protein [Tenacibaculum maritimum]MCD9582330.1 carbonic anhydrase family protein [Tenacibaculum maritimum]MCD9636711.1 carbonic anhydrase family protein [Tenacibaculum maritimum]CAA0197637.1 Carbonic anhydrase [Tenacibaculum maritimum]CAA0220161.1 Carbonic anhydrase [Tenacibaculum maritimum]
MKIKPILIIFIFAFATSCKYDKKANTNHKQAIPTHTNSHDWGYDGNAPSKNWKKNYPDCNGKNQSPIDIISVDTKESISDKLQFDSYNKEIAIHNVINNGHSVQFNFEKGDYHTFRGIRYYLKQIHFHEPSEHTINGVRFPIAIHLVHESTDKKLLVFAVMAQEGKGSLPFDFLESYLPLKKNESKEVGKSFSLSNILPKKTAYYYYIGSLTTPPCTEGVNWIVFKAPITVSKMQIEKMHQSLPDHNYRPIQLLNGRTIEFSK